jgi:2-dehydropantoate 2-reductase
MRFERLAVFGVGAIGSVVGGYLTRAGRDVTLIDLWPAHVEAMVRDGLRVTTQDEEFSVPVKAVHLTDVCRLREPFDAVILSVKSYDSIWAAQCIEPHLKPTGVIVSAQNGINEERIAPVIGYTRTIGCVVTLGAGLYDPGHVTRTSAPTRPSFALGELNGMLTARLQELVTLFASAGPARATGNLWGERWAKLTSNSMANPIAGMTGMGSAELRAQPAVFPILLRIAAEALRVAEALGVQVEAVGGIPAKTYLEAACGVGAVELRERVVEGSRALGVGRPSLLQDILKGRRTEVDYLNGYVARKGREVGIPAPMNEAVVQVIKRVEAGELAPSPANLDLLAAHL